MMPIDFKPLKIIITQSNPNIEAINKEIQRLSLQYGIQGAFNALLRSQVAMGIRKPTLAIYDHTGHLIGGGQKYGFTIAYALQDIFDITLLLNKEVTHDQIRQWYHLDLASCKIKIIPLPFFDQFNTLHFDPARVTHRTQNPFHAISKESGNYDFFINNSMNEKVYPLSNESIMICHFPERRPRDYFYSDRYTHVVYNSKYTAHWIQQKWKFKPHKHIYPPVDMAPSLSEITPKENLILSVARFEEGGSKKQLEMVQTFLKMRRRFPQLLESWQLVLAGGSAHENDYLKQIRDLIAKSQNPNIQLLVNIPGDQLKELYHRASIFWHLCGLDATDPALVEHFGMTIVEAMQNRLVPIVFDGGGQKEIVEDDVSGYRVSDTPGLIHYSMKLIGDEILRNRLSQNAYERSKSFTRQVFEDNVKLFFVKLLEEYKTI